MAKRFMKIYPDDEITFLVIGKKEKPIRKHIIKIGKLGSLHIDSATIKELREARPYKLKKVI